MISFEFNEEEDFKIPSNQLSQESALTIYNDFKNKISIDFPNPINQNCYVIRSNGYIGQVPINDEFLLIIKPKVPIQNIFSMLEYAYNLKSIQFLDGITGYDSVEDIFEYLASIFAKMVIKRNKKGLYQSYIEKSEHLPYIKGRLNVKSTASALINKSIKIECEYDELTADLIENKIIAWTLYRLLSYDIKRQDVRLEIRHAYRAISGRVETTQIEIKDCVNQLYNKLNEDYKPMHALCRFFLEHSGPLQNRGEHEYVPFILNMPILFESFVAEWLKINIPDGWDIEKQYNIELDENREYSFKIDLVIFEKSSHRVLAVLDTKYKRTTRPLINDIHEIVSYAVRMNTESAILIYPSLNTKANSIPVGDKVKVYCITFDLNKDLKEAGDLFLKSIKDELYT
jgi:5-methylcytosine-specific restriction enzyme subunit McrC